MKELGELKWIFNKTSGISDSKMLKEKVLEALKNADGSPIDELQKVSIEQVEKIVGGKINEFNKIEKLIEGLNKDNVFNQIFEITN